MNILFDIRSIIAIAIFIICAIAFTLFFLGRKIGEWRKARARKLLAEEIAALEHKIKQLEQWETIVQSMRAREQVLCPTLLKRIIDMLPDPNKIEQEKLPRRLPVRMYVFGRGDIDFELDFVSDANDVPTGECGLTVAVYPTGQRIRFTLKQQTKKQYINGVSVEVNGCFWDFRFSGIQLISDEAFRHIIDFALASRTVGKELAIGQF